MSSLEPQVSEKDNSGASEQSGTPAGDAPRTRPPLTPKQRAAVIIAVVVAAVGVGGGVVYASSHTSAGSTSSQQGPGGFGNGNGFPGQNGAAGTGQSGAMSALSNALYGEFVASGSNGGTTTMVFQTGTVTSISSTSVTVKSTDNHTATYTLTSSSTVDGGQAKVSSVKTGDQVTVVATKSDNKVTTLLDTTLLGNTQNNGNTNQQGGTQNGAPGGTGQNGAPAGAPNGTR